MVYSEGIYLFTTTRVLMNTHQLALHFLLRHVLTKLCLHWLTRRLLASFREGGWAGRTLERRLRVSSKIALL